MSSPKGHQRSPLKAQTRCSLQTQMLDEEVTQTRIPPKKSCLGTPCQEGRRTFTTLPGKSSGMRLLARIPLGDGEEHNTEVSPHPLGGLSPSYSMLPHC